ncbi:PepSY domain-containing protein [Draconibacterium sp.]|nr:PepSY domain-containing protein [Draconibacterium sp.]
MKLYRKLHRYFGLIIGVQFLFWTLGGIFFAWSDIDQIHGDFNRKPEKMFSDMIGWQSPDYVYAEISKINPVDSILSFKTINILGKPFYQVRYFSNKQARTALADVRTGKIRPLLDKEESVAVAVNAFTPNSQINQVKLITEKTITKQHEYRGQPLPAYAVTFMHKSGTTVYVSAEYGQIIKFRNANWRIFDFLWMMHTMDYSGRDNFGNILLRVFSLLGLITLMTGFVLFYKTRFHIRKGKN